MKKIAHSIVMFVVAAGLVIGGVVTDRGDGRLPGGGGPSHSAQKNSPWG